MKHVNTIFQLMMLFIIICIIFFGYSYVIEPKTLEKINITIESDIENSPSQPVKIAFFADTHFSNWYTPKDFEKVIEACAEEAPDMILFGGDLIDAFDSYEENVPEIIESLSKLSAPLGKYAVFGNHDYGGGAEWEYKELMESAGFTVLMNEYHAFEDLNLALIGIDDMLIGYGNTDIVSWARPDYFNLVLAHEPDIVDEILGYNADLMLAGHTHGGQVNFFGLTQSYLPSLGRKYSSGQFDFDNERNTTLFVSKGLGTTRLPLRFNAPPDIVFITIK